MFKSLFTPVQKAKPSPAAAAAPAQPAPVAPAKPKTEPMGCMLGFLLWLASLLKALLIGGKDVSEVIGDDGVDAFRKFGGMSIRIGDVAFGWIFLTGMSIIFIPGNTWVIGLISAIAGFFISTGTFTLVSVMWDVALGIGNNANLPPGLRVLIAVLAIPVNLLDSLMDAGAAIVMTGLLYMLSQHPYSEWNSLANEHALLFIVTGILATLFFLFSFFGELITKILELKAGTIQQANVKPKDQPQQPSTPAAAEPHWLSPEEVRTLNLAQIPKGFDWYMAEDGNPRIGKKPATAATAARAEPH